MPGNPLETLIVDEIRARGPISVARYMELCITHPVHGYYTTRDPFGPSGDFVTAPEISQMFGELIGLWVIDCWQKMGEPENLNIVELGPGRGTLMADALRTMALAPRMQPDLVLVESSPILRDVQKAKFEGTWVDTLDDVPEGPAIFIANEFFDALPIEQCIYTDDGWHNLQVTESGGTLERYTRNKSERKLPDVPVDTIREFSPAAIAHTGEISQRVERDGGAALIIDYGYDETASGDSLQGLYQGEPDDIFAHPGDADLTAHVDFGALCAESTRQNAAVLGPVSQARFLRAMGLYARADRLKEKATSAQRAEIDAAVQRLTAPTQMGTLFKVMAIRNRHMLAPLGFDAPGDTP